MVAAAEPQKGSSVGLGQGNFLLSGFVGVGEIKEAGVGKGWLAFSSKDCTARIEVL